MKKYKLLIFLLLGFFACNNEDSVFDVSTTDLKLNYKSVPGGAMLKYILPDNHDIFSMNIRYISSNGKTILKSCGYGGDSVLLDGFTKSQQAVAQISFLDNYGKESKPFDFEFSTDDSAPWTFFNDLEVSTSWDGFKITYGETSIATGMAHIFYLGKNPMTQKPDTVLVSSFPINAKGDTLFFDVKQNVIKNTVIVRTEDFAGYRVRQEIFPDIESFRFEIMTITAENFNDSGLSTENEKAKTGVKYLFDGETKGRDRLFAPKPGPREPQIVVGGYLAGPYAIGKPFIIDLKKEVVPAKLRMYAFYKMNTFFATAPYELGTIWNGFHEDKIPCNVTVYGSNDSSDETAWEELGKIDEDPKMEEPWYLTPKGTTIPTSIEELAKRDPVYIDINLPPVNNAYRYLKFVINDTFDIIKSTTDFNVLKYITLTELEVYVKKN